VRRALAHDAEVEPQRQVTQRKPLRAQDHARVVGPIEEEAAQRAERSVAVERVLLDQPRVVVVQIPAAEGRQVDDGDGDGEGEGQNPALSLQHVPHRRWGLSRWRRTHENPPCRRPTRCTATVGDHLPQPRPSTHEPPCGQLRPPRGASGRERVGPDFTGPANACLDGACPGATRDLSLGSSKVESRLLASARPPRANTHSRPIGPRGVGSSLVAFRSSIALCAVAASVLASLAAPR
jgi:hypothetical protein